jgi:hypothetical protein
MRDQPEPGSPARSPASGAMPMSASERNRDHSKEADNNLTSCSPSYGSVPGGYKSRGVIRYYRKLRQALRPRVSEKCPGWRTGCRPSWCRAEVVSALVQKFQRGQESAAHRYCRQTDPAHPGVASYLLTAATINCKSYQWESDARGCAPVGSRSIIAADADTY